MIEIKLDYADHKSLIQLTNYSQVVSLEFRFMKVKLSATNRENNSKMTIQKFLIKIFASNRGGLALITACSVAAITIIYYRGNRTEENQKHQKLDWNETVLKLEANRK